MLYEVGQSHGVPIDGEYYAEGIGRSFAIMAMHLGKTPAEAVELTALFDSSCGNGVDVLGGSNETT